ncbi:pectin lyase-like protein [Dacryopinax primogenitus]|uniref:galacturonan 1,4-alpha-galacturonidase n=1 Tax=Dacryopinax primogenitus (strain DJM 731) TaxID=1858805 RepID=M5FQI0_DACPD|nr:pectin lyase-like protein [Dacryopinax primogenitus]EJT99150.1 pectin lyase-like protein [Dacryopinax primogenitus]
MKPSLFTHLCIDFLRIALGVATTQHGKTCILSPLGVGKDDTDQVLAAISRCGKGGHTVFRPGGFNITRKMTWELEDATVDLWGYLNFQPDIQYWLNYNNTYRVVFVQSQALWFVVTGSDFIIDAHNAGGINGNGQPWWEYFTQHTKADGDGRPISLTVYQAQRATIKGFRIESPPFWSNCVAESQEITYDGMFVNATNTNSTFFGQNIDPNTDGINTFRSNNINLFNWDITCGDDCLAIKGNSTNIHASNYTCRGGNGVAFGSLGQYVDLPDYVENVLLEDFTITRLDHSIQPNMGGGVYFKTWTGETVGVPPTGGGGGTGKVENVVPRDFTLNLVDRPVHVYQTNGGNSSETPSELQFADLSFMNWRGTADTNRVIDIECSAAAHCPGMVFSDFNIELAPSNLTARYTCINVVSERGIAGPCNATT